MSKKSSLEVVEKRKFLRLQDYFRVSFHLRGEAKLPKEAPVVGYSKNLSIGGICFVSKASMPVGQHLSAEIIIPELGEPVAVVGEVVRVREIEAEKHEIALKFLPFGMDEETRNRLELFIFDHFL
jgi:c-di-GMP-binding flagellar brake protein YcgR